MLRAELKAWPPQKLVCGWFLPRCSSSCPGRNTVTEGRNVALVSNCLLSVAGQPTDDFFPRRKLWPGPVHLAPAEGVAYVCFPNLQLTLQLA